ncbi:MAG: F0F1 ATP synthase subunit gamma, partial [Acidobacteria bacterium]
MPTQLDIKRRIRSVKNTQQITRAMKFVAAARLRRAQEKAFAARPYARAIARLVRSAVRRVPEGAHALLRRREEKRILLLAVSGERGLCGAFNANVIRRALEFLREHAQQDPAIIVLG